jgi:hypothetical protein
MLTRRLQCCCRAAVDIGSNRIAGRTSIISTSCSTTRTTSRMISSSSVGAPTVVPYPSIAQNDHSDYDLHADKAYKRLMYRTLEESPVRVVWCYVDVLYTIVFSRVFR